MFVIGDNQLIGFIRKIYEYIFMNITITLYLIITVLLFYSMNSSLSPPYCKDND